MTKPALDLSGSGWMSSAFELLLDGGTGGEEVGDGVLSFIAEQSFTSDICDLSQPKKRKVLMYFTKLFPRGRSLMFRNFRRDCPLSFFLQFTMIRPFLTFSIDATRTSTEGWTPIALEFYFVFETRCAICKTVACWHRCQP